MKNPDEQERRDKLNDLLIELSNDDRVLNDKKARIDYYLTLEEVYYQPNSEEYFRHYYSDIFATLTSIDSDDFDGDLETLSENIQALKDGYVPKNVDPDNNRPIDISKSLNKLYDHTNLDIARISYMKQLMRETKSEQAKTESLYDQLKEKVADVDSRTNNAAEEIRNDQKNMQKEYITILGIFASIVIAFTGGMTFSSSVLNNIASVSVYRAMLMASIVGMVFFDLIWVLLDFIRSINGKDIRKTWLFWAGNVIFGLLILLSIVAFECHWFAGESKYNPSPENLETPVAEIQGYEEP